MLLPFVGFWCVCVCDFVVIQEFGQHALVVCQMGDHVFKVVCKLEVVSLVTITAVVVGVFAESRRFCFGSSDVYMPFVHQKITVCCSVTVGGTCSL